MNFLEERLVDFAVHYTQTKALGPKFSGQKPRLMFPYIVIVITLLEYSVFWFGNSKTKLKFAYRNLEYFLDLHFYTLGHIKKGLVYHFIQLKNTMRAGGLFFIFYIFLSVLLLL